MKIFPIFLLFAVASGIRLECEFLYGSWGILGTSYTCLVTSMDYTDDPIRVSGYSGTHLDGYSGADVQGLLINCFNYTYNLRTVPQGLSDFFPNFITMNIVGCSGIALTGSELIDYSNLKGFGIIQSALDRVPGNLFQPTPNLMIASFMRNQIERVGFGLLDNLMALEEGLFVGNVCINQNAERAEEIPGLIEALRNNCGDF